MLMWCHHNYYQHEREFTEDEEEEKSYYSYYKRMKYSHDFQPRHDINSNRYNYNYYDNKYYRYQIGNSNKLVISDAIESVLYGLNDRMICHERNNLLPLLSSSSPSSQPSIKASQFNDNMNSMSATSLLSPSMSPLPAMRPTSTIQSMSSPTSFSSPALPTTTTTTSCNIFEMNFLNVRQG